MADAATQVYDLAKSLVTMDFRVDPKTKGHLEKAEDVRRGLETLRQFLIAVLQVIDLFEYQLSEDLTHAAGGNRRRARRIVRPLKAVAVMLLAGARLVHKTYSIFLQVFGEELGHARREDPRDPFQF